MKKTGSSVSVVYGENSHGHFARITGGNRPRESTYSRRVGLFYKMAFALPNMEVKTIARTIMENHSDKVASSKAKYVRLPGITNIRTTPGAYFPK